MTPKLAQVITRMVPGGASTILEEIIRGLGQDYEIDLITGEQGLPPALDSKLDHVNRVIVVPSMLREISPLKDLKALKELKNIFENRSYDLVHTHTSKAGILGRLAAYWAGANSIVHTPHGLIYDQPRNISGVPNRGLKLWFLRQIERITSHVQDVMTTLTDREKSMATELGLASSDNVRTIHNGIRLDKFEPSPEKRERARNRFGVSHSDLVLVSVGRVAREKGYGTLLEAFEGITEQYDSTRLIIAGEGPQLDSLKDRYRSLIEEKKLIFPGHVNDVETVYWAGNIYVHPALFEGFGLSLVEAMASGCPVVASNVGGIPELVRDDVEGLLVEPGSKDELKTAIINLLTDEDRRTELSRHAKKRSKRFDHSTMVKKYQQTYENLLN